MATPLIIEAFGNDKTLYDILNIDRNSTSNQIKKAYFRLARIYHPDKNPNNDDAKTKFQALSLIHSILSNDEKRKLYDETGDIEDYDITESESQWMDYWRNLFPKITLSSINNFALNYKGSLDEKEDIIDAYNQNKGDLDKIFEWVPLSNENDYDRFINIINDCIKDNTLKYYEKWGEFNKENNNNNNNNNNKKKRKRKKKMKDESKEAEELLKLIREKNNNRNPLNQLILKQERRHNDLISSLEQKYIDLEENNNNNNNNEYYSDDDELVLDNYENNNNKKNKKKRRKKKKRITTEPNDEEWEAIQKRLWANKNKNKN